MDSKDIRDAQFEAVLRLAVIESFNEEMAALPPKDELKKLYTFSKKHERKMKRIFFKEQWSRFYSITAYISKRVAILAVCVLLLFSGLLLANKEVRAAVQKTIVEWLDGFARFRSQGGSSSSNFEDKIWTPDYLPEGFYESSSELLGGMHLTEYTDDSGTLISFDYMPTGGSSINVDTEYSEYSLASVKGIDYHIFDGHTENRSTIIVWECDGLSFVMEAVFDKEELLKTATSVSAKFEDKVWKPDYLPEGFYESSSELLGVVQVIEYTDAEGTLISFIYSPDGTSTLLVDNEYTEYSLVNFDEVEYHIFDGSAENRPTVIVWECNGLSLYIEAMFNKDELLKMATSVALK